MIYNAPILGRPLIARYMILAAHNLTSKQADLVAYRFSSGASFDEALSSVVEIDHNKLAPLIDALLGDAILFIIKFNQSDYMAVGVALYECLLAAQDGREAELSPDMKTVWDVFNSLPKDQKDYIHKSLLEDPT